MKKFLAVVLLSSIALPVWAGGDSSDGHTHAAPAALPAMEAAPRASAASEEFEVVIALEEKKLVVYVDRFTSNEPITKAKIEVEGAGLKGLASEIAPGTYVMEMAAALAPGKHALTIGIEAGETADLLAATLDTTQVVAGEVHVHSWDEWAVWILAAVLLLASIILLLVRRNRKKEI